MRVLPLALPFVCALLTACPSAAPDPEPPTAAGPGVDPTVPALPGQARAAVLTDGPGFNRAAWGGIAAEARPGDLVLFNDRVRFAVRARPGHGYVGVAGALIDADLVRPAGQLGRDTLEEAFVALGIGRVVAADRVTVVADGRDGGSAIVRAQGSDVRWTFVEGVIESGEPIGLEFGLEISTDYILAPDRWSLEIVTTFHNPGDETARINPLDGQIAAQEELWPYESNQGMDPGGSDERAGVGQVGKHGEASMLLFRPDRPLDTFGASDLLSSSGIELVAHGWTDIPPGESFTLRRFRAIGPDTATVEGERLREQGVATGEVAGRVTTPDGTAVAGARVHLVAGASSATPRVQAFAVTDANGDYRVRAEAGTYTAWVTGVGPDELVDVVRSAGRYAPYAHATVNALQIAALDGSAPGVELAFAQGHPLGVGSPVEVALDAATNLDLTLAAAGSLRVQLTDAEGAAIPGVISATRTSAAATTDLPSGLRDALRVPPQEGRVLRAWTADGDVTLPLPPGTYEVEAFSSWRHEAWSVGGIVVPESGEETVTLSLAETVPHDGWLAMDSHLHGAPSTDGSLPMEDRLVACTATGVDIPVTTDHDRQSDYGPLATALGLDGRLLVIPGVEVSPVLRGHFNLFPVAPGGPEVTNGGAPAWWEPFADTDALFARIRASAPAGAILQVNHGRADPSGLMSAGDYDPSTGTAFRPEFWSFGFDVFELINDRGVGEWEGPRADWFSWLNLGQIRLPTGVSDSHGRSTPCGYGRTDLYLGVDSAADTSTEAVLTALRAGHVVVGGVLTLRATGPAGALPGDTVSGGEIAFAVDVRGPSWVRADVVRVYRNGVVLEERPLGGTSAWTGAFHFQETTDAWYVIEAQGADAVGGPWGGAVPYAITNAFFVDVAGDGWEAPGLQSL